MFASEKSVGGYEKITDDATNGWPMISSIPWTFKYWLMCLCRAFLT